MEKLNHIKDQYSYTTDEQATFPYLREYMNKITDSWPVIFSDANTMRRFMLAGLFLTYRACCHIGAPMTTDPQGIAVKGIHRERLLLFEATTGVHIGSTADYLNMLGNNAAELSRSKAIGELLYAYVLTGAIPFDDRSRQ